MGAVPARDTFFCIVGGLGCDNPRPDFFTFLMLFPMSHPESKLTPAQIALLEFCQSVEPYQYLSTTLSVCIGNYMKRFDDDPEPAGPTPTVLEAWYFMVDMLALLHDIAAPRPAAAAKQ